MESAHRDAVDGRGRVIPALETTSKIHMRRALRDACFARSSAKRLIQPASLMAALREPVSKGLFATENSMLRPLLILVSLRHFRNGFVDTVFGADVRAGQHNLIG